MAFPDVGHPILVTMSASIQTFYLSNSYRIPRLFSLDERPAVVCINEGYKFCISGGRSASDQ